MEKMKKRKNEEKARITEQDKFKDVKYESDIGDDESIDQEIKINRKSQDVVDVIKTEEKLHKNSFRKRDPINDSDSEED